MTWSAPELLRQNADTAPGGRALADDERAWTWRDLSIRANVVAGWLAGRGVRAGDRVALAMPTSPDTIAVLLGILRARAVAAVVPAGLTARETDEALGVIDPALVVRDGDLDIGNPAVSDLAAGPTGVTTEPDPEAAVVVVLTSGTTGRPKAVVLSSRAMAASADAWLAVLPPVTGWAMPLGIGHVAGLGIVWRAIRQRVPIHLVSPNDPAALLAVLEHEPAVSHVSLVPGQLVRLLDAAGDAAPPPSVRAVLLGGGAIPESLVVRAIRAGWPVVPTYGLSEMGSGVTALPADEAAGAPGTAGRPLPGVELAIVDPGADGVGEILVSGPSRSSGYLDEPVHDPRAPVETGDLGRLDVAGRLVVVDRRTDRIVRGGENIAPIEVESVLVAHPAIAEAAVVGRPDDTWGQVPVAAIVLEPGAPDPGNEALAAHARASLAGFKVPAAWRRLDVLPRTTGGKLRRDAVRALIAGAPAGELVRPGGDAIGWRVSGSGDRHVLLLHGTLSTSAQLDRLARAMAAPGDVTVHAIDRRGSGSSRLSDPRPLDIAVHVADLVAYLDARGIDRASIVGVSFGGVVALESAARHPERVDAVIAYEPPYGALADPGTLAWFRRLAADTAAAHALRGRGAAAETFLRAVAGDAAWDRLPDRARSFLEHEGDGALADAGLTGLDPDGLGAIDARVTIVTGAQSDAFYVPLADALAERIPAARRETLPGMTHPSPITEPAAFAVAVRTFLELPA